MRVSRCVLMLCAFAVGVGLIPRCHAGDKEQQESPKPDVSATVSGSITIISPDGSQHTIPLPGGISGGIENSLPSVNLDLNMLSKEGLMAEALLVERQGRFVLGVFLSDIPEGYHALIGIDSGVGVMVQKVIPGSPAEKAGFQQHDLILLANGKAIGSAQEFRTTVMELKGQPVEFKIRRGKKQLELTVPALKSEAEGISGAPASPLPATGVFSVFSGPGVISQELPQQQLGELTAEIEVMRKELQQQQVQMKQLMEMLSELTSRND